MRGGLRDSPSPEDASAIDETSIEQVTGLSMGDIERLGADPSPDVRAEIAVRFAHAFDGRAQESISRPMGDLLEIFSRDREKDVRRRFAYAIRKSRYLSIDVAERLAKDEIDVAAPILRNSPVLNDDVIADIIRNKPEPYALAIADRRPLQEAMADLLVDLKGTRGVTARLLDNDEADLSEASLLALREWVRSDPDIKERLRRRPNLPFAFVDQSIAELAEMVHWPSLIQRTMTRSEATLLQDQVDGTTGYRCPSGSKRFDLLSQPLKDGFEKGTLDPPALLAFLRNRDINRLECGFSILTGLDLRTVRRLLYGSDRRGLVALCLKANFTTADYLAFRMVLTMAELGTIRDEPKQHYPEAYLRFAQEQFEKLRGDTRELQRWLPPNAA